MKKLKAVLCTVLLLCSMGTRVQAARTDLTAEVPEKHTVTIESEGGLIVAEGSICGDTIQEERHKEQTYWIIPAPGKRLKRLSYNGEDVTSRVKNGTFTAPVLSRNATLEAVYTEASPAPDTKTYDITGTVVDSAGVPVPKVTLDIGGMTCKTDEKGTFEIKDLPSGTHPVIITREDGTVTAHGEIVIERSGGTALILRTGENGAPVIIPSKNTKTINLVMEITQDGEIKLKEVKDTTPAVQKAPAKPAAKPSIKPAKTSGTASPAAKTGDDTPSGYYILLLLTSAALALCLSVRTRRR